MVVNYVEERVNVETRSFIFGEVDDETELLNDVAPNDDVVGAMLAVVKNN